MLSVYALGQGHSPATVQGTTERKTKMNAEQMEITARLMSCGFGKCETCEEWTEWVSCPECDESMCAYCVTYVEMKIMTCEQVH